MKKTVQVIMLPTRKALSGKECLWLRRYTNELNYSLPKHSDVVIAQHLYLVNDEQIQYGDWCKSIRGWVDKFAQCENSYENECKNIVATTDPKLIAEGIPSIPESFVKQYVASNGSIKEVELETQECKCTCLIRSEDCFNRALKLTTDNEVVIVDELTIEYLLPKEQCGDLTIDQKLEDAAQECIILLSQGLKDQSAYDRCIRSFKAGWQACKEYYNLK